MTSRRASAAQPRGRSARGFGTSLGGALVGLAIAAACTTPAQRKREAIYGPTESVLEVIAVLRRHVADDTYRFPPATDFTGRNVYRASLLRLENIERIHAESLRAGHLDGVVAFAKARALERLRAYDLAAQHYRLAAERDATLRDAALASGATCDAIADALSLGFEPDDPLAPEAPLYDPSAADAVVAGLDARRAALLAALPADAGSHYRTIVREELERCDMARAHWFEAMRFALPQGQVRAVAERQRVATRHAASHRHLRHLIALANLYATLAHEYVAAVPPESLAFDPARLRELSDAATKLYQRVATRDGAPEKLEAARRLEAFLAFTLQVDRDRFTSAP